MSLLCYVYCSALPNVISNPDKWVQTLELRASDTDLDRDKPCFWELRPSLRNVLKFECMKTGHIIEERLTSNGNGKSNGKNSSKNNHLYARTSRKSDGYASLPKRLFSCTARLGLDQYAVKGNMIYIYIYIYICMCIYIYIYVYIYIYI